MKYVILSHPTQFDAVVLGFSPMSHADLAAPYLAIGYQVATAGFARIDPQNKGFIATGESESLRARSHPDDSRILTALYRATLNTDTTQEPT